VLSVLLARAAGAPLGDVLRDRLFAPAGMASTGVTHPAGGGSGALADQWGAGPDGALAVVDPGDGGLWSRPPAFPSVEGGLVSTADDVVRFGRLLLAGGALDGRRVLPAAAVEAMTTDQLTADQRTAGAPFLDGRGWGLGLAVPPAAPPAPAALAPGVPRGYGWDGGLGTSWANDPTRGLVALLVTQVLPPPFPLYTAFWEAIAAT
jgi:CubicO group peptidase (beta-lactamase class C family)